MKILSLISLFILASCATRTFKEKVNKAESCTFHEGKFYFANFDDEGAYINSYDSKTWLKVFLENLNRPKGVVGYQDYILINDDTVIHFYSIKAKKIIKTLKVPGAIGLNDITVDEKGNFFSSDSKGKAIFSGNIASDDVSKFFDVDFIPNGVLIDGEKLLVASWGDEIDDSWNTKQRGRLWEFNFGENKLKLFSEQRVGYLDGIAKIGEGKYLVSAKRENEIYLFEKGRAPSLHSKATGPADIGVSASMICIPSYSHEKVEIRDL